MMLTPDGRRYLAMAGGIPQPMPFALRWMLPAVCGTNSRAWMATAYGGAVAASLLTGVLAAQHGLDLPHAVAACVLVAGLPWVRFAISAPVLTDMPALACALLCAVLMPVSVPAAMAAAVVGATLNERVPVFAALFAWSPIPLLALAVVCLRFLARPPAEVSDSDPHQAILRHPLRAGLRYHAGHWRDPRWMLTPWGTGVLCLLSPSVWLVAALVAAYAQMLVATDTVRLYQQAAPVVAISAVSVVPLEWLLLLCVLHVLNPLAGEGL